MLFAYDGPLYKNEFGQYADLTINDFLRERYLHLGEEVTFLMRVYNILDNSNNHNSKIRN